MGEIETNFVISFYPLEIVRAKKPVHSAKNYWDQSRGIPAFSHTQNVQKGIFIISWESGKKFDKKYSPRILSRFLPFGHFLHFVKVFELISLQLRFHSSQLKCNQAKIRRKSPLETSKKQKNTNRCDLKQSSRFPGMFENFIVVESEKNRPERKKPVC